MGWREKCALTLLPGMEGHLRIYLAGPGFHWDFSPVSALVQLQMPDSHIQLNLDSSCHQHPGTSTEDLAFLKALLSPALCYLTYSCGPSQT